MEVSFSLAATREPQTSCVLQPVGAVRRGASDDSVVQASPAELEVLLALDSCPDQSAESREWRTAIEKSRREEIPDRTFHRWRKKLADAGLVELDPQAKHRYRLTEAGATAIGVPFGRHLEGQLSAMAATPPKGVADGTGDGMAVAAVPVGDDPEAEMA